MKTSIDQPTEVKPEAIHFLTENLSSISQYPQLDAISSPFEMNEPLSLVLKLWNGMSAPDRELPLLIATQSSYNNIDIRFRSDFLRHGLENKEGPFKS